MMMTIFLLHTCLSKDNEDLTAWKKRRKTVVNNSKTSITGTIYPLTIRTCVSLNKNNLYFLQSF